MVGPLISYGFGTIHTSLDHWKPIYLWAGFLTLGWSFIVFWIMPDDSTTAKFFSERERFVAIERVRNNNAGLVSHKIKWNHVREAVTDPAAVLLTTLMFTTVSTNSMTGVFAGLIIKNLGFTTFQSLLLQIPTGFFGVLLALGPLIIVLKTNNYRLVIFAILSIASITGTAILFATPHHKTGVVLVGYYFNNCFVACPAILLGSSAANFSGHTKKSTTNSMIFVAYCAGSIMSPLIMNAKDNYHTGFEGILICQAYAIIASMVLLFVYRRRNKHRDITYGPQKTGEPFRDETDFQNFNFRYSY